MSWAFLAAQVRAVWLYLQAVFKPDLCLWTLGEQLPASWVQARVRLLQLWPWLEPNPAPPWAGRGARARCGELTQGLGVENSGKGLRAQPGVTRSGMGMDKALPASLTLSCSCSSPAHQQWAMSAVSGLWETQAACPQPVAVPDLPVTAGGGPACPAGMLWDLYCSPLWALGCRVLQGPERMLVHDRGKSGCWGSVPPLPLRRHRLWDASSGIEMW